MHDHLTNIHDVKRKNQSNIKRLRKISSSSLNNLKFFAGIDGVKFSASIKFFAAIDVSIYVIIKSGEKGLALMQKFFESEISKSSEILKLFAEMFSIAAIKNNFPNAFNISVNKVLLIIKFFVNLDSEIDIDYDFRG